MIKPPGCDSPATAGQQATPCRILHVVYSLDAGGLETIVKDIICNDRRELFAHDVLAHCDAPAHYDEQIKRAGARLFHNCSPGKWFQHRQEFSKLLREYGPYDVVHVHHLVWGPLLLTASRAGVPVRIAHCHNDLRRSRPDGVFERFYWKLGKYCYRRWATRCIAVSGQAAASIAGPNWNTEARWKIWISGHDFSRFHAPRDPAAVRLEHGIPATARVVGHVGSFTSQKNHEFLLKIFHQALKQDPSLYLVLIGDGPEMAAVCQQIQELGLADSSVLTGVRPDVPDLLNAMDVFLFPSLYEGLPGALVEAQAAGLPCVISNTIADEAEMIPGLIHWRTLDDSTEKWSKTLFEALEKRRITCRESYGIASQSHFEIHHSLEELHRIYGIESGNTKL